ncbi:MAG: hypothetical protein HC849_19010 [Oscillatoriales cyanobacterium RU_3_3]|nr:hypothetical protein [Microcoleus sp. SU_5_6]NJL66234.1 hypothetical protein [Microcoleus sp. SM1_3_4]NJM61817.1 hypothetical protein [Oscillatoriales cyanobacterium RU_3_3]NJR22939.1 hypothetical protein [Richelia sp. CSU_2_1]
MSSKSIDRTSFDITSEVTIITDAIHFEVGQPSQSITVDVIGDGIQELKETITVTFSSSIASSSIASLDASITTTTILDAETLEILSVIQLI